MVVSKLCGYFCTNMPSSFTMVPNTLTSAIQYPTYRNPNELAALSSSRGDNNPISQFDQLGVTIEQNI